MKIEKLGEYEVGVWGREGGEKSKVFKYVHSFGL
jgi:hypothetical protein